MKMKVFLLIVGILCANATMASPVGFGKAMSKAKRALGKEVVSTENLTAEVRARMGEASASPSFYVFNAEDGQGFVIISGEDQMPEVLAYSHTGRFDATNIPPALVSMLDNYMEVVDEVRNGEMTVEASPRRAEEATPVVGPLCRSQWGQDKPYNTLCPSKDGEKCPVGCVATALAQIMYHFAWPVTGTGSNMYASGISGVGVLKSNFYEHTYAWDVMEETTRKNLASEAASAAVAQLSYDCGIATRMSYDPEGSGTNDDLAMAALYTYFGYRASSLRIEHRACYATQEEWNDLVKSELNANRPVLYAGFDSRYGGHEFIIDGYDDAGFFHVNWGWNGSSDAYYSIVTLSPSRMSISYSLEQSMVCGIEPDETGEDKTPQQFRIYMEDAPTMIQESISLGHSAILTLNNFFNYSRTAHTWTCAVALYSLDGEQLAFVSNPENSNYTTQILSLKGYSRADISIAIPEDTPDGYYSLRAVFRQEGYDDFILPDMVGGSERNNLYVQVKDGVAYFNAELPDGINTIATNTNVVTHDYYDVSGKKLSRITKGIVIDRQTLPNGQQIVKKIAVK